MNEQAIVGDDRECWENVADDDRSHDLPCHVNGFLNSSASCEIRPIAQQEWLGTIDADGIHYDVDTVFQRDKSFGMRKAIRISPLRSDRSDNSLTYQIIAGEFSHGITLSSGFKLLLPQQATGDAAADRPLSLLRSSSSWLPSISSG